MPLTPSEKLIVKTLKSQGVSNTEIQNKIAEKRLGVTVNKPAPEQQARSFFTDLKSGFQNENLSPVGAGLLNAGSGVTNFLGGESVAKQFGGEIARQGATEQEKMILAQDAPSVKQTIGSGIQLGSAFIPGAAGTSLGKNVALGAATGYLQDVGSDLQADKEVGQSMIPGVGTVIGAAIPVAGDKLFKAAAPLFNKGRQAVGEVAEGVASRVDNLAVPESVKGAGQTIKETAERVPRFFGRVKQGAVDAAERSNKIKVASEPVKQAYRAGLSERVINTVEIADDATKAAYREAVDIAEQNSGKTGTLAMQQRPEIVAGNAASNQYKLIDQQRRQVGSQIGEAVDQLSKDVRVPISEPLEILDDVLVRNSIVPVKGERGIKLDFSGSSLTKAERSKIEEMYKLTLEGGNSRTPRQIYNADKLFSKLQRESRMEGIGNIIVETGEGDPMSLFRVFRDVFSNTLDEVSPTDVRALNRQYRDLITLQDDIENSIIKSGNFETSKNVDPAEFAQTNLRRLFSDAGSAASYREIAKEMDLIAKELGYIGASPADVAAFATELRKIYPDNIPATGITGSIRASLTGIAEGILNAGKASIDDQQKALRGLLGN